MSDAFDDCIVKVEKIVLKTPRPREIGFNSRKGAHGIRWLIPWSGFTRRMDTSGWDGRISTDQVLKCSWGGRLASSFVFRMAPSNPINRLISPSEIWRRRLRESHSTNSWGHVGSRTVELYDGSIYIDDLDAEVVEAGVREEDGFRVK